MIHVNPSTSKKNETQAKSSKSSSMSWQVKGPNETKDKVKDPNETLTQG